MNTENHKESLTNLVRNAAMDLACQAIIPGYVSGPEDLTIIAELMVDVAAKKEGIGFPERFRIADSEQAFKMFTSIANSTIAIDSYLIQGASIALEYANLEALSAEELEEIIDEL